MWVIEYVISKYRDKRWNLPHFSPAWENSNPILDLQLYNINSTFIETCWKIILKPIVSYNLMEYMFGNFGCQISQMVHTLTFPIFYFSLSFLSFSFSFFFLGKLFNEDTQFRPSFSTSKICKNYTVEAEKGSIYLYIYIYWTLPKARLLVALFHYIYIV